MSLLVWVMMGIAVWHFTVFVPDRFWGGIVGAFLAASIAAALFGLILNGGSVPGQSDTDPATGNYRQGQFESWTRFEIFDPGYR